MFSVIAGSGHCGTTWLASILDSQPGATWHHHFRELMARQSWEVLDLKAPDAPIFNQYWLSIRAQLKEGAVGDANSWPPHLLTDVNKVQPIDRVIYLTRNGIQQLHSLTTKSPILSRDPLHPAAEAKLEALYFLFNGHDIPYADFTRWEKLCLAVSANKWMPDYLRSAGLNVDDYSLEELTTDLDKLAELAPELDEETLANWQKTDINRKVEGSRAKSSIWRNWTKEQRAAYKEIVE